MRVFEAISNTWKKGWGAMPRGPLPNATRRRTNPSPVPTTNLPLKGRKGAAPRLPKGTELGEAGSAWWKWAWATPHAAAWSDGDLYVIARRASLEDDLAALAAVSGLDLVEMLMADEMREFRFLIERLASLCTGRLAIMKEMRELETRLGLNPKAKSDLRWEIVDVDAEKAPEPAKTPPGVTPINARRERLIANDAP